MIFRVEIRDRSFNILDILDREIINLSWEYSRVGGCGGFKFTLPRKFCDEKFISGDFNIRIYIRNDSTKIYDLWYQGFVETKNPSISGHEETIDVIGQGYAAQLSRVYHDKDYTSQEISLIVKDIIDNYVEPVTDIIYDASLIAITSFTPDSLKFNTQCRSAIESCADIAGTREWGVDKDRKFFFKARSISVGFRFWIGKNITNFSSDDSFKDIVNSIFIQGGDVAGVPYTKSYDDTLSQAKYGKRTKVIQNSAIVTDAVSEQYADSIFAEFNDVVRRAKCTLVDYYSRVEITIPIPLAIILASGVTYGTKEYGTFLYSGLIERQINRINYNIDKNGILSVGLELGYVRPNLAEEISKLEYQLEQQRQGAL